MPDSTDPTNTPDDLASRKVARTLPSGAVLRLEKPPGRRALELLPRLEGILGPLYLGALHGKIEGLRLVDLLSGEPPEGALTALLGYAAEELSTGGGATSAALLRSIPLDALVEATETPEGEQRIAAQLSAMMAQIDRLELAELAARLFADRAAVDDVAGPGADLLDALDLADALAFTGYALEYAYRPI